MMQNARAALDSLSLARDRRLPTAAELRHVREYLSRLPMNPVERFVALK